MSNLRSFTLIIFFVTVILQLISVNCQVLQNSDKEIVDVPKTSTDKKPKSKTPTQASPTKADEKTIEDSTPSDTKDGPSEILSSVESNTQEGETSADSGSSDEETSKKTTEMKFDGIITEINALTPKVAITDQMVTALNAHCGPGSNLTSLPCAINSYCSTNFTKAVITAKTTDANPGHKYPIVCSPLFLSWGICTNETPSKPKKKDSADLCTTYKTFCDTNKEACASLNKFSEVKFPISDSLVSKASSICTANSTMSRCVSCNAVTPCSPVEKYTALCGANLEDSNCGGMKNTCESKDLIKYSTSVVYKKLCSSALILNGNNGIILLLVSIVIAFMNL
jgi:hypothetical protein